jgi:hypothetical protein
LFLCKESWIHFISLLSIFSVFLSIFSVFRTVVNSDSRFQDGVVGIARDVIEGCNQFGESVVRAVLEKGPER